MATAGVWSGYAMSQDGSGLQKILPNTGATEPFVAPDGRTDVNAFLTRNAVFANYQVGSVRRDGSQYTPLVVNVNNLDSISYSPAGDQLLYENNLQGISLLIPATGSVRALTPGTPGLLLDSEPSYSPDLSQFVFVRNDQTGASAHPGFGIYTAGAADGAGIQFVRGLSGLLQSISHPHWSPDGNTIVFGGTGSGLASTQSVFTVAKDGSALLDVTGNSDAGHSWSNPVFTPDGQKILFVRDGHAIYSTSPSGQGLSLVYDGGSNTIGAISTSKLF
jgi:Tol biopolymer transport system component